jgi:hypothetical protein
MSKKLLMTFILLSFLFHSLSQIVAVMHLSVMNHSGLCHSLSHTQDLYEQLFSPRSQLRPQAYPQIESRLPSSSSPSTGSGLASTCQFKVGLLVEQFDLAQRRK